jgi:hypothetical protein
VVGRLQAIWRRVVEEPRSSRKATRPENWIKDLKNVLATDRLSCPHSWANACRLLLHTAFWLLDQLRCWTMAAAAPRLQHELTSS